MSSKKTILIFIDWFSPGYKAGGPVSSNVNLITWLKSEFCFKVVTRDTEYMETTPYEGITPNRWISMDGFEGYYIGQQRLSFAAIKNIVRTASFDIAYVNGIYSLYFSILPLYLLKKYKKKVIVSSRGMLSPHALAVKGSRKKLFLKFCRWAGLYRNVIFHATNEEEAEYIRKITGKRTEVLVAPNLPKVSQNCVSDLVKKKGELKLIYVGRIAPEKNTLYAIEIMKSYGIHSAFQTEVSFTVYGSIYSQEYWLECENLILELPANIQVTYHGALEPARITEMIKQSHFLFQPTKGENYGHTIAESLQNAVPVIISDRTPWRSLEEKGVGWDIPLEQPQKFIEIIEYCAAMGQEEYNSMSRQAFDYAKQVTEDPQVLEANRRLFS